MKEKRQEVKWEVANELILIAHFRMKRNQGPRAAVADFQTPGPGCLRTFIPRFAPDRCK